MKISAYTLSSPNSLSTTPQTISNTCYFSSYIHHNFLYIGNNNNNFAKRAQLTKFNANRPRNFGAISASGAESVATDDTETWLLEPIGDGDSRHIGFKVSMPSSFEIASNVVTVGRVPEKADLVIPVATVSGVHARIQKKGRNLIVTDLDSTNGTFIGEKRLKPGVSVRISSGSSVTFGDSHLAMFRVSKLDKPKSSTKPDEPEAKLESEVAKEPEAITESLEPSIILEKS